MVTQVLDLCCNVSKPCAKTLGLMKDHILASICGNLSCAPCGLHPLPCYSMSPIGSIPLELGQHLRNRVDGQYQLP